MSSVSSMSRIGINAAALYVPPYRVRLDRLATWTGADPEKLTAVVGRSFRMTGAHENVYTMAAASIVRLIVQNDLDPRRIGFLAFGTESSTDNAAGAVILKGLVNQALAQLGRPLLPRDCEVPEFKHACLGGVYALKAAARWLACDGRDREAIVATGDVAEYARGTTGEPTQGAGAVAFHVTADPALLSLDFGRMGSSSAYRTVDFRKPARRHEAEGYAEGTERLHDFPVFNGKYSTACYTDAVVQAVRSLATRTGAEGGMLAALESADHIVMHRPYRKMPSDGLAAIALTALLEANTPELGAWLQERRIDREAVLAELAEGRDLWSEARERGIDADAFPALNAALKAVRGDARMDALVKAKLELGAAPLMDLGNLYTASLPAWLLSLLETGAGEGKLTAGATVLAIGYGSGDAAEALALTVQPGFEAAARRIDFASALADGVDLDQAQYEALHDGRDVTLPVVARAPATSGGRFRIEKIGQTNTAAFQDIGIEYYGFDAS